MEHPNGFQWLPEYDSILEDVAQNDAFNVDWKKLRDIIKHKLEMNIALFLSRNRNSRPAAACPPTELPLGGLKLPPFPPRRLNQVYVHEPPISYMNKEQADELKSYILKQLDGFEDNPPFTIQRVCELCIDPNKHYKSVGKYLRAVEKTILVTSSWDEFPPQVGEELHSTGRGNLVLGPTRQSAPSTPLFSPIPFLHRDSRRSQSLSPPPTPLSLGSVAVGSPTRALGMVDEMDEPGPGHMSEHPTPLSSVTTVTRSPPKDRSLVGTLQDRFVKGENMSEENAPERMAADNEEK